jgi:hypothetical protein
VAREVSSDNQKLTQATLIATKTTVAMGHADVIIDRRYWEFKRHALNSRTHLLEMLTNDSSLNSHAHLLECSTGTPHSSPLGGGPPPPPPGESAPMTVAPLTQRTMTTMTGATTTTPLIS